MYVCEHFAVPKETPAQFLLGGLMLISGVLHTPSVLSLMVRVSVFVVGGGGAGALTVMNRSHWRTRPPLVTVSTTSKVPFDVYVWMGCRPTPVPPSPNCQA